MMHKLTHILFMVFIACVSAGTSSCTRAANKNSAEQSKDYIKGGFVEAKVIRYDIDGCSWMLELSGGKRLQPLNLGSSFQKEELAVWVKYQLKKDAMGICMAGEIVEITNIELKK